MTFTDIGTSAGRSAFTRTTTPWTTNPQAELINSLCSLNDKIFPRFDWLPRRHRPAFREACNKAFFVVKDYVETLLFEKLTDAEKGVFLAIQRKTLRFNKLMETISRKAFYQGHVELDGTLKLNIHGNIMLPPSVPNCSAVSKGVNGLLKKRLISRMDCAHQDRDQKVYSAGPLEKIIPCFVITAFNFFSEQTEGEQSEIDTIGRAFADEVFASFDTFIRENGLEWAFDRHSGG
ncbi:hypothetical protein [Rhizobium leguminosarum]|uniref:hypothetical protein n=1 Tax=Rhizobium leguminosarum TaxID=384 RepID=UPI001C97E58C|nr:hypothetical protein [Rhizobium leguminosarum]MBY5826579.1 hypothetical protein [Rhizobium leguminosarum]